MTIIEAAKLSGISKRALHHYDKIGLLCPKRTSSNGYRIYDESCLKRLEQILLFRELGFSLTDISNILDGTETNRETLYRNHKDVLVAKKERLERIIVLVESRIEKHGKASFKEFDMRDIEKAKRKYGEEAKQRWGYTESYKQSEKKTSKYSEEDWKRINSESKEILKGFSELTNASSEDKRLCDLVEIWREHITKYYYDCSYEMLLGLGEMYISDERFKKNLDKYGEGTARTMSEAIKFLCEQKINNR